MDVQMHAADILSQFNSLTRDAILDQLRQTNPEAVVNIERCIFLFDDIEDLTPDSIRVLTDRVSVRGLAQTFQYGESQAEKAIIGTLPLQRQQEVIKEIERMDPQDLDTYEASRERIAYLARRLKRDGKLQPISQSERKQAQVLKAVIDALLDDRRNKLLKELEEMGPQPIAATTTTKTKKELEELTNRKQP